MICMYALTNTFNCSDNFGTIISLHRTPEAARAADSRLQRRVRKYNSHNSYLPTTVIELLPGQNLRAGDTVYHRDCARNMYDEIERY
jgi:hypothetical protein